MFRAVVTFAAALAFTTSAFAQQAIFVVRHAERSDTGSGAATMAADPGLSDVGHARAASLATVLKDAQISTIIVTEYKRTQETAAPLAKALGVTPMVVKASDAAGLIARLQSLGGNALVVGHSNTVPSIIKALGVSTPVTVGDAEFDRLFVVTSQQPRDVIQLHYR